MIKENSNVITITVGYYEFYLYVDNNLVYSFDCDCTESWYDYEDSKEYAELCVSAILEVLKEDEKFSDYKLVKKNKNIVIDTIATFVADWCKEV